MWILQHLDRLKKSPLTVFRCNRHNFLTEFHRLITRHHSFLAYFDFELHRKWIVECCWICQSSSKLLMLGKRKFSPTKKPSYPQQKFPRPTRTATRVWRMRVNRMISWRIWAWRMLLLLCRGSGRKGVSVTCDLVLRCYLLSFLFQFHIVIIGNDYVGSRAVLLWR